MTAAVTNEAVREELEVTTSFISASSSSARNYSIRAVALIFSVPALGGCLFGYDIGATSFAIAQIITSASNNHCNGHVDSQLAPRLFGALSWTCWVGRSPFWQGFIVAGASLGALLGSLWMIQAADRMGRRQELRLGACLYMMGAILEVAGGHWSSVNGLVCLIAGRLIYGVGIGITMHGAPTYLAEQTPSPVRGLVVSCKEAAIVLGILLGYAVGDYFSNTTNGWAMAYACSLLLSILMWALSYSIPRSCRWLLLQGHSEEALQSLSFVWKETDTAERELDAMQRALDEQQQDPNLESEEEEVRNERDYGAAFSFIWDPRYRAPLIAGVGLVILQQITGQPSVLSYAAPIFQQAGFSSNASVVVAAFKLIATLVAAGTVEQWGRKNLLYTGCSMMLVALIVLAFTIGQVMDTGTDNDNGGSTTLLRTLILIAMFLYICGYQFSFGPIAWLIISEVFPLQVRGQAVAFAVLNNFFWNALVQFGVPVLSDLIGLNVTFGIFAVLTAYSLYFVRANVPETKGLDLEQIEAQFRALERQRHGISPGSAETEPLVLSEEEGQPS